MNQVKLTTEQWEKFVKVCNLLEQLPEEKQKEIYFMSEGAKMIAEKIAAA